MSTQPFTDEEMISGLADKLMQSCDAYTDSYNNHIKTVSLIAKILKDKSGFFKNNQLLDINTSTTNTPNTTIIEDDIEYEEPKYGPIDPANTISAEYDSMIARRAQLHKNLGTFDNSRSIIEPPTITPLHKLGLDEQESLYKRIFKTATYNVEKTLNISRDDTTFPHRIKEEADRLLDLWVESNKKR